MKAKQKRPSGLKAGSSANEKAAPNNGNASSLRGLTSLGSSKAKKHSENGIASYSDGKVDAAPTLSTLLIELERHAVRPHDAFGNPTDGTTALESIRKIHEILSKIDDIEKQVVRPREKQRTPEKRLQILKQWLEEKGIQLDGFEFQANLREGSGVFASKDLKQGELIFTVPENVMMTQISALASTKDCSVLISASSLVRDLPSLQLALHLLFEKHRPSSDPSPWKGYIDSLPGVDDGYLLPLGYSIETLEKLEGTQALYDIYRALRNFVRQYVQCRGLLASLAQYSLNIARANQWFTYSEWLWAISVVLVRQNNIPHIVEGQRLTHIVALIPVMDSVNHEPGPNTSQFDLEHRRMELTAKRDFKAGEQIYFSYGHRLASLFFLYNGFVPEDLTPRDRIKIPVSLSKSDPLYKKKAALLKLVEVPTDGLLELMADGSPERRLAIWVRVAAMSEEADVVENLRLIIEQNTQQLRAEREAQEKLKAEKAELEQKAAPNGKETTDDKKSSGVMEGSGSSKEGAAEKDGKAQGNGKADVVAEQSNGAEADGSAQNGAEEEEGFPEHALGEELEPAEELQPREAALLVSIIEQTLDRYPEVQALEAAEKSDAQLEGGEKAGSASEGAAAALARGVQGLGLGVKDPLGRSKKPERDPRSEVRLKEMATAAAMLKLERTILSRGAERQRRATQGTWETEVPWVVLEEEDAPANAQGSKAEVETANGKEGSKTKAGSKA